MYGIAGETGRLREPFRAVIVLFLPLVLLLRAGVVDAAAELDGSDAPVLLVLQTAKDPKGASREQRFVKELGIVLDGVSIRVEDGNALLSYLVDRVDELEKLPSAEPLKSATRAMKDGQSTLIDIARKIYSELDALGLKRAFSGRCHLCPV